jgi:hypothetical protein
VSLPLDVRLNKPLLAEAIAHALSVCEGVEALTRWDQDEPVGYQVDRFVEACGVFFMPQSKLDGAHRPTPVKFLPVPNRAEHPERGFAMTSEDIQAAILGAYSHPPAGTIHTWHSHRRDPQPSRDDLDFARQAAQLGSDGTYGWWFAPTHLVYAVTTNEWHSFTQHDRIT